MNGAEVMVVEELCTSLYHAFMRSDNPELEVKMVIYENHSGEMVKLCSL